MTKILFVCLGNICRSPMAEYIMKSLIAEKGLENDFEIASAATSSEEEGNPVYPPAKRELLSHGISCEGKFARQMTKKDYDYYDLLIGMDESNIRNMKRIAGGDKDSKIHMLMDYTDTPKSVADPWYTGNFTETWNDCEKGCRSLLKSLAEE